MNSDNFTERLIDFAIQVIDICNSLPKSYLGIHIKKQIIRSSTAIGANYEEARGAESDADFLHKMNIALKEARETLYWNRIIERARLMPVQRIENVIQENKEICAILISSVKTLKKKRTV